MAELKLTLETFDSLDGPRWRLKGVNGEVLATSEAYSSRRACLDTAALLRELIDPEKMRVKIFGVRQ